MIKCYTLNSTLQPKNQTLIYSNKIIIKKKIKNIYGIIIINKDIKYIPKQFLEWALRSTEFKFYFNDDCIQAIWEHVNSNLFYLYVDFYK